MELSKEKLEIYEKNLQNLQEAADELMRRMKGYDYSYRREITDRKGEYCPEKLHGLVEEMLSLWEEKLRANRFVKEGWVKSYLRTRRELYGLYLYLVMRCSLCPGGYYYVRGREQKERTDFAFLLEQAKWFSRSFCITDGPDGSSQNELRGGYDGHFGFHLYSPINHYLTFTEVNVRNLDDDWALTPPHLRVENRLYSRAEEMEETEEPEEMEETEEPEEMEETEETDEPDLYDDLFYEDDDDGGGGVGNAFLNVEDGDFWDPLDELDEEDRAAWWEAEYEQQGELDGRNWELLQLVQGFEGLDEYCSACRRFAELFQKAGTEIPWDFCRELEEIVNQYLARHEIAPLADTDKALNVYSRVCEGPLRLAKSYGRELQWKAL